MQHDKKRVNRSLSGVPNSGGTLIQQDHPVRAGVFVSKDGKSLCWSVFALGSGQTSSSLIAARTTLEAIA
jgi:hypothetical protein